MRALLAALVLVASGCGVRTGRTITPAGAVYQAPIPADGIDTPPPPAPPEREPGTTRSQAWLFTAAGTPVNFPRSYDRAEPYTGLAPFEREALVEIDETIAYRYLGDAEHAPDPVWPAGVPAGWKVVVELPVFEVAWLDGPILAAGMTDFGTKTIHAGSRRNQDDKIHLPALAWELGIARRGYEPAEATADIQPLPH